MHVNTNQLKMEISRLDWFHSIDLNNGLITPGRKANNETLYSVYFLLDQLDIKDLDCLDIGCKDGIISFILEMAGAKSVTATDLWDMPTVNLLKKFFHSNLQFLPKTSLDEIPLRLKNYLIKNFDLIILSGVLYHLPDPLTGLLHCRDLIRAGGLFILETAVSNGQAPVMTFSPGVRHGVYTEPTTFWLPTPTCVKEMLYLACFEVLQVVKYNDRCAVLAKAIKPSDVKRASPWVNVTHRAMAQPVAQRYFNLQKYAGEESKNIFDGHNENPKSLVIRKPQKYEMVASYLNAIEKAAAEGVKHLALFGTHDAIEDVSEYINLKWIRNLGLEVEAVVCEPASIDSEDKISRTIRRVEVEQLVNMHIDGVAICSYDQQEALYKKCKRLLNSKILIYRSFKPIELPLLEPRPEKNWPIVFPEF